MTHLDRNPQRVAHYYQHEHTFDLRGIEFPVALKDIDRFERQNDVSVSVYGFEEGKEEEEGVVYPLRVTRIVKPKHVNMLLIANDDTNHYCWIKNMSKLLSSQYSNHNGVQHFCRFCLHGFRRADLLEKHEGVCYTHSAQRIEFPEDTTVQFKNIEKQVKAPFIVYADFESLLREMDDTSGAKSVKYQEHIACSYAYYIVSNVPGIEFQLKEYVGPNAAEHFLNSLQRDLNERIMPIIEKDEEMIWDDDAKDQFRTATHCYICAKELDRETQTISRDHCHFTGRFRGAVHQDCNFEYKIKKERYELPTIFHNLRGYDAHLIFQAVQQKHGRIQIIPNNFERYISFSVGRIKFLDSMQFLSCSLEQLAENVSNFTHFNRAYPNIEQRTLLTKKGVYPYDYMNSEERFSETDASR